MIPFASFNDFHRSAAVLLLLTLTVDPVHTKLSDGEEQSQCETVPTGEDHFIEYLQTRKNVPL